MELIIASNSIITWQRYKSTSGARLFMWLNSIVVNGRIGVKLEIMSIHRGWVNVKGNGVPQ